MAKNKDCVFCKIVADVAPCHKIWEDEKHLAFLNIYPNTLGAAVVVTKEHYDSYAFDVPDDVLSDLTIASKKVAKLLDNAFPDVGRTALVYEGYGINHVHAKLFPMHGTNQKEWKPILSGDAVMKYFEQYEGYISSHSSYPTKDEELATTAEQIRKADKE